MLNALQQIRQQAAEALAQAGDLKALDDLRVKYLGKKGELTAILKQMGKPLRRGAPDGRAAGQRGAFGHRGAGRERTAARQGGPARARSSRARSST